MSKNKNAWLNLKDDEKQKVMDLNKKYIDFLNVSRTERLANREIIRQAKENGFVDIEDLIAKKTQLKAGDRVYVDQKGKAVLMFVIGSDPIDEGLNIVGAHIDSPRLDLKQNPLYESDGLAMLKTHYYGGVKKYQYATIPLAIHGIVFNKSGEKIEINIGLDEDDPVFCVSDLLIHLSKDQLSKSMNDGITGEMMNVIVGNMPLKDEEKDAVKANILKLIKEKYNFEEEDFKVAELEVVSATKARELGLDRSMVLAYGQDDRICAFATLEAILEVKNPKRTALAIFADKEEIGSVGNAGMDSHMFENAVAEVVNLCGDYCHLRLMRTLRDSKVLSADVSAGYDPDFAYAFDKLNSAYIGNGVCINKYTGSRGKGGSNDANAEFLNEVRKVFDDAEVTWQTAELGAVDQGGGGTIALLLSKYGAEVVDCGPAVLSMHSPHEISSKVDTYMSYKAYKAFME